MKQIKVDRYWTPKSFFLAKQKKYLEKAEDGLLFDFGDIPENYEIIIRPIYNKRKQQIIYQNFKER